MLRGPVHLHHSAVAIGDDHSRSELIERSQRSGRFPRQVAKLGMQSGRVAQGLKQLLKPRATNRTERRLVDPLMNAKNDGVGRVIEEPRPDNVTNTGLDYIKSLYHSSLRRMGWDRRLESRNQLPVGVASSNGLNRSRAA